MSKINEGYEFKTAIVGESNYKPALKKCYKDPDAFRKGRAVFCDVTLKLDNDNKYDDKAVAVTSKYGVIGFLPKSIARKYRSDYNDEDGNTVRAKVTTRDTKSDLYGVWIDLGYEHNENASQSRKPANNTRKKSFWSSLFKS
ncbi:hypothetical protein [Psychrobacter sp.]|uniref:hypothetical protein n=1 Tax=Psychrobacter sp. TaxID=56811 RepID=UPI003F9A8DF5